MTKIALISDTHGFHDEIDIPICDILIHAGDYSSWGNMQELIAFNEWLGTLDQCKNIVVIDGNHDLYAYKSYSIAKHLFTNATYLRDELVTINGLKIWGSPWSRTYGNWAYMCPESELLLKYQHIPENIDILVSHTPAYGVLDHVPRKGHTGSVALADEVKDRIKPKLLVCGHLHDDGGKHKTVNGIIYANAAICDEDYIPSRSPIFLYL